MAGEYAVDFTLGGKSFRAALSDADGKSKGKMRTRKFCPCCGFEFSIGLKDALRVIATKEWKLYCPHCHTCAYVRFGLGTALLSSFVLAAAARWILQLPGEFAMTVLFVTFVPIGVLLVYTGRLVNCERRANG